MRVGTISYATTQGLGVLAKSFFDAGVLTDILIVEHHCRPTHFDWFPGADSTLSKPMDLDKARAFIDGLDTLLVFETPFHWSLMEYAINKGVLTALMPMYECMPRKLPVKPHRILCPSRLDLKYYPEGVYIPVPVEEPFRQRTRAEVFVHNSGNGGLWGRNGTVELIAAMTYVESPLKLVIRSQKPIKADRHDERIEFMLHEVPREDLYQTGDVFVFPEKFNGLSLPLQEAFASGMLVMATDRFPNDTYLPKEALIPVSQYEMGRIGGCQPFRSAVVNPRDIALMMDRWYGQDITLQSSIGQQYGETNSWAALKPRYMEALTP